MALDDRQHVEAVALLRDLLEQPGMMVPLPMRAAIEGWLAENHPEPRAYMNAMGSLAGREPKPMLVTLMLAERMGARDVLMTFGTGVDEQQRMWPFELTGGDAGALGRVLLVLDRGEGTDIERMRRERDSLTQALAILDPSDVPPETAMPVCPMCGAASVEGRVQQVTRDRGVMERLTVEPGVVAYKCENGHYHDGERETGPVPEDVTIKEGLL